MNTEIKRVSIIVSFVILLIIGVIGWSWSEDVTILPMRGPIATAKLSPASGSATAYKMDIAGQQAITFINYSTITVFLSSHSAGGTDGFPLITLGSFITYDLRSGTTVYLQGNTGGSDIRVTAAR